MAREDMTYQFDVLVCVIRDFVSYFNCVCFVYNTYGDPEN